MFWTSATDGRRWPRSVAVFGAAGLVGSGVVARLVLEGHGGSLTLHDPRHGSLRAHAVDLDEARVAAGVREAALVVAADPGDVPVADLVLVAASAPEGPETDRLSFLAANLEVLRELAPHVARAAGEDGVVLVLSNPVDVLAGALRALTGMAPERILGYSFNDSVRFRLAVARELGIAPERIEAWVLGEHGAGQVPLFSRIRVDGAPASLTAPQQDRVRRDVDGWFARWAALRPGRSSGWTTPVGTVRMIRVMASGGVMPASVWTGARDALPDTYLTLPARLGPLGLRAVVDWPLDGAEREALVRAAGSVRRALEGALHRRG